MSTRFLHFQIGVFGLLAILLALDGCSSSSSKSGNTGGAGTSGAGFGGSGAGMGGAGTASTQGGGSADTGGAAAGGAPVGAGGIGGMAGAAGGSSGGAAGAGVELTQCSGAPDPCLAGSNLVGTWHCPGNSGLTLVIRSNGSFDIKNGIGQHGLGCITCTGSFEDVSAADSGGSPNTFVDVNGQLTPSTTMAGSATIKFQYCGNTTDLGACTEAPMSSAANDTCSKTGP